MEPLIAQVNGPESWWMPEELGAALETLWRAGLIYIAGLVIVRLGKSRLLGRATAFDVILGVVLGSLFSRAINGIAPVGATLLAGGLLVLLHGLTARLSYRWPTLDTLFKGRHRHLVLEGRALHDEMNRADISRNDLDEALRLNGSIDDPTEARKVCLERNGEISVLPAGHEPRVVELGVEEGVKRVRIEFDRVRQRD